MEFIGKIFALAVAAIFVQNFVLMRFLGLCPYIGVSKKLDSALGMGMAVIFVITSTVEDPNADWLDPPRIPIPALLSD